VRSSGVDTAVMALLVALAEAIVIIGVATRPALLPMWWLSIPSAVWPRGVIDRTFSH